MKRVLLAVIICFFSSSAFASHHKGMHGKSHPKSHAHKKHKAHSKHKKAAASDQGIDKWIIRSVETDQNIASNRHSAEI